MKKKVAFLIFTLLILDFCLILGISTPLFNNQLNKVSNLSSSGAYTSNSWFINWGGSEYESCNKIITDSNNNIYITGYTSSFGEENIFLVKYNTKSEKQWECTWGGNESEDSYGITIDNYDNIYIVGGTSSFGANKTDVVLIKYNTAGEKLWNFTWGGLGVDEARSVKVDSSENMYLTGITNSYGSGSSDAFIIKFNSSKDLLWNYTWGGALMDESRDLILDSAGNIYIMGLTYSFGSGGSQIFIIKYNNLGERQWNYTWGDTLPDYCSRACVDSSDNVYLGGAMGSHETDSMDLVLLKYDTSGILQWNRTWNGKHPEYNNVSLTEQVNDIAIDNSENIYLVGRGYSVSTGYSCDFLTTFNNNGKQEQISILGVNDIYSPLCITFDIENNLYVAGYFYNESQDNYDIFLLKNPTFQKGELIPGYNRYLFLILFLGIVIVLIEIRRKKK